MTYLSVELVGGFPSLDDLLDVSVDRSPVTRAAFDEVDRGDYRLACRSSAMNLLDSGVVAYRSAVRVMTRQVDQEVRVIPFLHAAVTAVVSAGSGARGRDETTRTFLSHIERREIIHRTRFT